MRLFVAIDLDQEDYFKKIQEQIPETKATYPKTYHLTLKFLGEIDKQQEITKAIENIKFKPFKLKTTHIGVFPSENYIKVVWLGLEDNNDLKKLQQDIEKSLESFNFKKDFDFHPHITLARIKFIKQEEKQNFIEKLKQIKFEQKEFEVKEFKLIKSELTSEGPVYEDIKTFTAVSQ
ncbi:RNA 2',3'-cyclic phosphodiesterase [Candidatus Woesearchaeota archaeon]|nr:RNA 2',3'-cyclic phosphodiesterase [Candidatus Woesearchaeota archaeon]